MTLRDVADYVTNFRRQRAAKGPLAIHATDVSVTATGGSIGPAYAALVYDSTSNKPLIYIDFGQAQSAGDTTDFKIVWDANGLIKWSC